MILWEKPTLPKTLAWKDWLEMESSAFPILFPAETSCPSIYFPGCQEPVCLQKSRSEGRPQKNLQLSDLGCNFTFSVSAPSYLFTELDLSTPLG